MLEDKELDELEQKRAERVKAEIIDNYVESSDFQKQMDVVKVQVLEHASIDDESFANAVKNNLKSAAVKHSQVEQKRADFEGKKIDLESEKLDTKRQRNQNEAIEDKWDNLEKRREFHFNGVRPIMGFVGINEPMNLFILYFLTALLTPFYLISKLIKGTFGVLIAGAANENRPRAVKGFLWTIIGVLSLFIVFCLIYLFLKWQGMDIFKTKFS